MAPELFPPLMPLLFQLLPLQYLLVDDLFIRDFRLGGFNGPRVSDQTRRHHDQTRNNKQAGDPTVILNHRFIKALGGFLSRIIIPTGDFKQELRAGGNSGLGWELRWTPGRGDVGAGGAVVGLQCT